MGLGPNGESLLPRVSVLGLPMEDHDKWGVAKQAERSCARAFGLRKRAEAAKQKGPKPRRHKHHCYCIEKPHAEAIKGLATSQSGLLCCRCLGEKCCKPKSAGKRKKRGTATIVNGSPATVETAGVESAT